MTYFDYLIASNKHKKLVSYVGYTKNLKERLKLHNCGKGAKFTKGRKWKLLYYEKYTTKNIAMKREYELKKSTSLRNIIKNKYK